MLETNNGHTAHRTERNTVLLKRIGNVSVAIIFMLVLVFGPYRPAPAFAFAGGDGTSGNPYQITNPAELANLSGYLGSENSNVHFKLMNDITLTGSWTPIGNDTSQFYGKLDGDSKTVSGLTINSTGGSYLGLFGYLASGAQVTNLAVTDISITITSPPSFTYVGGIVGRNVGTITGSYTTGTISGGNHYNGGIAGLNSGTITNSYSAVHVSGSNYAGGITGYSTGTISGVYSTGTVTCGNLNGGIVGMQAGGTISNSYSRSTISGSIRAGGAVGYLSSASANLTNVYSTGAVTGGATSGGLVGDYASGTATSSYWDTETSGKATSAAGTGKTTEEMNTQGTFVNWNFDSVWSIGGNRNDEYPYLQWQFVNTEPNDPASLGPANMVNASWNSESIPTFSFTLSDDDAGDQLKYQVQIDNNMNFSSPEVDYTSGFAAQGAKSFTVGQAAGEGSYDTGYEGQVLANGQYYWRVKAIDESNAESDYVAANSGNIAFRIDADAPETPGVPTTVSPTSNSTPTWILPEIEDEGSGFGTLTFEWSLDSGFGSNVLTDTEPWHNPGAPAPDPFTHTTPLADGIWNFRVKATDAAGNESGYSDAGSVLIDTTAPTTPGKPTTSSTTTTNTKPTWVWAVSTDTGVGLGNPAYTIEWSKHPGFSTGVFAAFTNSASYTHSTALSEGTWYFRAKAIDLLGHVSSYSQEGSVTILPAFTTPSSNHSNGTSSSEITDTNNLATLTNSQDNSQQSTQKIILNTFPEYVQSSGKLLSLKEKDIIYFNVKNKEHSATIETVGSNYVIITLASTPQTSTLYVGEANEYDVSGDGQNDIKVSLRGISDGTADIVFRQLVGQSETAPPPMPYIETYTKKINWLPYVVASIAVLAVILLVRNRKNLRSS